MKPTNSKSKTSKKMSAGTSGLLGLAMLCFTSGTAAALPGAGAHTPSPTPVVSAAQSSVDSQSVREILAVRRSLNLARLLDYANAGEFPRNTLSQGPLNVFVDAEGHICAAANLIDKDGYQKLVQDTAQKDNYIVLSSVRQGPLMDWMLTSGFTQEEIALIQEPYMPIGEFDGPNDPQMPEPVFVAAPVPLEQERERVQSVLLGVHKLLSASTTKSLGIAVARLDSHPKVANALLDQPRFAQAPRFAEAP